MTVMDGLVPLGPMGYLALSDADGVGEPLLASGDLHGAFDGSHGAHISNAYVDSQQQCCLYRSTPTISVTNVSQRKKPTGEEKKKPRRIFSPAETAAVKVLKDWYDLEGQKVGQEAICDKWAELWESPLTQSGLSQYINGVVPLNVVAAIRLAPIVGCKPRDILDVPELRDFPKAEQVDLTAWPFKGIDKKRIAALEVSQKMEIVGAIRTLLIDFERPAQISENESDGLQRRRRRSATIRKNT